MTDKVQKIRKMIENRYEYWKEKESNSHSVESEIRMSECQHLLLMVDSLQEELVEEDFEKALASEWKAYNDRGAATVDALEDNTQELAFAKGFYRGSNWQKEKTLKESEDAIQYVKENHSPSEVSDFQNAMNIAVMKAFDAGKEKMREHIMKDAIDAEVLEDFDGKIIEYDETILGEKLSNCKVFDKVKVIVIKEE